MNALPFASVLALGLLALSIPLVGLIAALTPYLMPKRECFAVTVPDSASSDPTLRAYKRRYALTVAAASVVLTIAAAVILAAGQTGGFTALSIVAVLILSLGSFLLMLRYRAKVQAYKKSRGWQAEGQAASAVMGAEPAPKPLSLKWNLLFLAEIVITAAMALALYDRMPAMIPMHMGFSGQISDWAPKSYAAALFPAFFVTFIAAIMTFTHWGIVHSKKAVDPAMPAASAWAYGMFAHAQSVLLVVMGLLLGMAGPLMVLAFAGYLTIMQTVAAIAILAAVILVIAVAVSLVYGQNGSRLIARMEAKGGMPRDDDEHWKAGIFYANRNDPSLFLPERFGIGWTVNWGRPGVWAIMGALIVFIAVFVVLCFAITK